MQTMLHQHLSIVLFSNSIEFEEKCFQILPVPLLEQVLPLINKKIILYWMTIRVASDGIQS